MRPVRPLLACTVVLALSSTLAAQDCSPLPEAKAGAAYSFQFRLDEGQLADGQLTWSASGDLPPGLTLSPSGSLTGTPTIARPGQAFTFSVNVKDASGASGSLGSGADSVQTYIGFDFDLTKWRGNSSKTQGTTNTAKTN